MVMQNFHSKNIGKAKDTGTEITFLPSKKIFSSIKFSSKYNSKKIERTCFFK